MRQLTFNDHYKTLNVAFGSSEVEIKKKFRRLASIHHPDKNGGSKKSEETFKIILNAYETLSNKEARSIYDIQYKQYIHQSNSEIKNKSVTNSNIKQGKAESQSQKNGGYQTSGKIKPKINYSFLFFLLLLAILYLYNINKTTTTGNPKADRQLKEQNNKNRPESGELDFNK